MKKTILVLAIGIAMGYFAGFSDARAHKEDIVQRLVARVGGANRDHMPNDVDATMERLEKR